jgi:hypothetical protein
VFNHPPRFYQSQPLGIDAPWEAISAIKSTRNPVFAHGCLAMLFSDI